MSEVRYCVISDGDGHSWLVPVSRRDEALELREAADAYYERADYSQPIPDDLDLMPWARRFDGGIGALSFLDPREDL